MLLAGALWPVTVALSKPIRLIDEGLLYHCLAVMTFTEAEAQCTGHIAALPEEDQTTVTGTENLSKVWF